VELDAWEASRRDAAQQEAAYHPARRACGVEESLEQQFLVARVVDALGDLTPQQRLIFLLKHQEGMTYEEISATDIGGVVEFYPSRRLVTRFDVGDTMIRNSGYQAPQFGGGLARTPASITHNFQFNAGIGFRF
jgi:hypothetical protein